ncbi:unnamed protein product [Schistosoma mattheei]|uniref:Uncharacterized protein n=1 Tax=Schistosoma mattheei TaxID=31246 RepID=A0A183PPB1_9TREM|nr:unnamed protein product [Schistosoma mattheei]
MFIYSSLYVYIYFVFVCDYWEINKNTLVIYA